MLGVLLSFGAMTQASAAVFNLKADNLGVQSGKSYTSVSMSDSGVSMSVSAYAVSNDGEGSWFEDSSIQLLNNTANPSSGVYVGGSRIGVRSFGAENSMRGGDNNDLTGFIQETMPASSTSGRIDEGLMFSFSQIVMLDRLDLYSFGGSDDFNLIVDGVAILVNIDDEAYSPYITRFSSGDTFHFSGISGREFLVWTDHGGDAFMIDGIHVISAVPEPSTISLIALGLAGITFYARRRKA